MCDCYIFRIRMNYLISIIVVSVTLALAVADSCPEIISRKGWEAKPPKLVENVTEPVPYVVIHHTYIPAVCNTTKECKAAMRSMQSYHQDERGWNDIGYNFCIGGDGNIYEGRGWGKVGAHAPSYNDKSVGICFIGDYRTELPSRTMLKSGEKLIQCGMKLGHISEDYKLIGHRQVRNTACPGDKLFEHIKTMRHWTDKDLKMSIIKN